MCAFRKTSCLPKETQKEWMEPLRPSSFFQLSGWVSHSCSLRQVHKGTDNGQERSLRPCHYMGMSGQEYNCGRGCFVLSHLFPFSPYIIQLLISLVHSEAWKKLNISLKS